MLRRAKLNRPALALLLGSLVLLTGCLKVGPDWAGPPKLEQTPASFQQPIEGATAYQKADRWWEDFNDPEINRLVAVALKHNLDIKEAAARVLEIEALFDQTHAQRFPTLGAEITSSRSQAPSSSSPSVQGMSLSSGPTTSHNLSLAASFEVDLWGRLSRADEAARADLLAAEEAQRTVIQTVVAGVVASYLEIEALERRVQIAENALKAYRLSLDVVKGRYERGLGAVLEVRQASRSLAVAEARLPSLRLSLGKAQQRLAVLVGQYPKTAARRAHPEDYYKRPAPVPPGLPSELLLRRPDVRAAVASLEAANARIGQAKAARFPSLRLTAAWGTASSELSGLFTPASELWSIAAGLSAPIFDAGRLAAGQRQAEARYQQSVISYSKTVLNAFAEVEEALLTRQKQVLQRELTAKAVLEARATQREASTRYFLGLIDYISVLDAQKVRYQVEEELIMSELAVLTNRVTLHRVLGGGWDRVTPKPAPTSK